MADFSLGNRATYERRLVTRSYRKAEAPQAPEIVILSRLRPEFAGRRILDIGVGGGRTTPHLLEVSRDYVGIDYSARMIEACRKRFPSVAFRQCDARDLSAFDDGSFDLVMFSFNGIDYVGHADRLRILGEVRRVLRDGGAFVFSSHNRGSPVKGPWSLSHISPGGSPLHLARRLVFYPLGILNYYRNRKHRESNSEYAMINDEAHEFRLITYYISPDRQVRQLQAASFREVQILGLDGRWLDPSGQPPAPKDPWLYYVCRK